MGARIGDLLVARGVVTRQQIDAARADPRFAHLPLASKLYALGYDEGGLAGAVAERHGVPGVDLSRTVIPIEALEVIPREVAEADLILPLSLEGGRLHLAMARPWDERVVSEVRFVTGMEVSPYAALHGALERAITGAYRAREEGQAVWAGPAAAAAAPGPAIPGVDEEPSEEISLEDDVLLGEVEIEASVAIELGEPEPAAPRADGRPLVLVVDDEPEIVKLVSRTLESKGYAVESAADGAEALARADALVPDLILLDAMLPKVHGFEACRRLKSAPRTRHVPVMMMTAIYRGWRFAQDARENFGAEDYVEKPFRLDDLLRRIEAVRTAAPRPEAARPAASAAPDPELARGKELLAAGRIDEAAEALGTVVKADPFSADAHFQLGRALRAKGDAFAAMTSLERAVELRPGHLTGLRALAAVYEEKGFRRKAAETLERALAVADDRTRSAIREDVLRLLG